MLNVLVACEESQAVCKAFRALGHNAYSCDTQLCSGGHPEWHIVGDCREVMYGNCSFVTESGYSRYVSQWDLIIAHPPCTYLTNAGAVRMRVRGQIVQERYEKMLEARQFFYECYNLPVKHLAIENPTPMKICNLPPYTQAIQPYQFGHPYSKRTCLWLRGLPELEPTKIMEHHEPWVNGGNLDAYGNYRQFKGRGERDPKTRSKTFQGIANAMAEQWSHYILSNRDLSNETTIYH